MPSDSCKNSGYEDNIRVLSAQEFVNLIKKKNKFRTSDESLPELDRIREYYCEKRKKLNKMEWETFYEKAEPVGTFFGRRAKDGELVKMIVCVRSINWLSAPKKSPEYYELIPEKELPLHLNIDEPYISIVKGRLEGTIKSVPERQDLVDEYEKICTKLNRVNAVIGEYTNFINSILLSIVRRKFKDRYLTGLARFSINGRQYLLEPYYGKLFTPDSFFYSEDF